MGRWRSGTAVALALVSVGCAAAPRRPDAKAAAPHEATTLAPADGKWRTDAAGNAYYLERLPKAQGRRQADGTVRNAWGITLQVEREDDEYFYYKVFRPPPGTPTGPGVVQHEPTAAERAAVTASYAVAVREASHFGFAPFGSGLPTRGQWRQGFAIADMNGDGSPDIVHGPPRKRPGTPYVFLGDGAGHWRVWADAKFPPAPTTTAMRPPATSTATASPTSRSACTSSGWRRCGTRAATRSRMSAAVSTVREKTARWPPSRAGR